MGFEPRRTIPGLDPEAERALVEVQTAISRECQRIEKSAERPRRRVTELVEEGSVIARPGEVVRVQPGDEDVTVVLPEPSAASDGSDIVISFEGDGTAAGKVLVVPASGTCRLPGVQTLNAPGSYRFTATGGGATTKPRSSAIPSGSGGSGGGVWGGPPPLTVDDLPPIGTGSLVPDSVDNTILGDMPGNSVKVNTSSGVGNPTDLVIPANTVLGRKGGDIVAEQVATGQIADDAVTNAKLADMAANSVKVNATTGSDNPADIAMPQFSALVRSSGNITAPVAGSLRFLRSNAGPTAIGWGIITLQDLPVLVNNRFLANVSGADASPVGVDFYFVADGSRGLEWDPVDQVFFVKTGNTTFVHTDGTVHREAITGDVSIPQFSNTATIQANAVTDTKLRDSGALSVIGRSANSSGDPADISATAASGAVLRESGSVIGWGTVATAGITDDAVTNAKIRNSGALSVIGRSANSSGDPADISATAASDGVLRESGSVLGFGTIATGGIANNAVTNAKLATMAARTVKGRADSAGTGDPQDLTGLQLGAILRMDNAVGDTTSTGSQASYPIAAGTNSITFNGVTVVIHGIQAPTDRGQLLWIRHIGAGTCTLVQESSTAGATTERLALGDGYASNTNAIILGSAGGTFNRSVMLMYTGSRWQRLDEAIGELSVVTQLIAANAVTDTKIRDSAALSVIGRSANSSGDPADIAAANDGEVLRRSGTALGFGTIATAGIADDAVTNAKLANMAERRIKGRADSAGTGDPQDLTGAQVGAIYRWGNQVGDSTTTGSVATLTVAASTNLYVFNSVSPTLHGISVPTEIGQVLAIQHIGSGSTTIVHESSTAGAAAQRFRLGPFSANTSALVLTQGQTALFTYDNRWLWVGGAGALIDGDKGDISVTSAGATWTIDNNVVSDAKLRDSAALSVIGRSANSTGDPADIAAASDGEVLRRSGTALGFGTIATAGLADNSVSNAKLRDSAALSVIGRNVNSSGDPADISTTSGSGGVLVESAGTLSFGLVTSANILDNTIGNADLRQSAALSVVGRTFNTLGNVADISTTAASDAVLRESGSTLAFGQIATGGIANDAVTDGKLRNSGALSVIGRSANSAGDPADISGTASSDQVLRVSGTALGFGTVATAGIADNAVADTKLRQGVALSVIGRSPNSTGNVSDIAAVAASGAVFRESGSTIGWGTVATAGIADDAVSNAKIRNSGALSVIGRSANSSGDPADISATAASDAVLRESGSVVGFGTIATGGIAANAVTNAKLAQMAASTIKGRASGSGTGDPTDLSGTQVAGILSSENITWSGAQVFNGRVGIINPLTNASAGSIHNYNIGSSTVVRFSAATELTGLIPFDSGHLVFIINVSSGTLAIAHENVNSSASNRFAGSGTSLAVRPGEMQIAWYDSGTARWYCMSGVT